MPDYFIGYYKATLDYFKTNKWLLLIIFGTNVGQGAAHLMPETKVTSNSCNCVLAIVKHVEEDH